MPWNPFKGSEGEDSIIHQADLAIAQFEAERETFAEEKHQKMQRQVELWSILTPSDSLRNEYKMVSSHIAYLIKKMMCLDEHIKELKLARYHAQNGSPERLQKALTIVDPCKNIEQGIAELAYQV